MFTHELTSPTSAVVYTIYYMGAIMIIPRWIQLPADLPIKVPDFALTIIFYLCT
jgi:hypothetical protein